MNEYSALLLAGEKRRKTVRKITNASMLGLTGLLTLLALVPLFWIVGYVVARGGKSINLDFFTQFPKPMGMSGGGVLSAIEGTIIVSLLAAVIAFRPV